MIKSEKIGKQTTNNQKRTTNKIIARITKTKTTAPKALSVFLIHELKTSTGNP